MRHYFSKTLAIVFVVAMILSITPISLVSAADPITATVAGVDFVFRVGTIEVEKGAKTVAVPLTIEEFRVDNTIYKDDKIACLSFILTYETAKLKYTGMTFGDMILKANTDMIYNERKPGEILVSFTTYSKPITSAGIAANNLFATVNFDIVDTNAFVSDITIEAEASLMNNSLQTLISKENLADCLKSGAVVVKDDAPAWSTATDSGFYMSEGLPKGIIRFLFSADIEDVVVEKSGIVFANANNIAENVDSDKQVNTTGDVKTFSGDIINISTPATYYAKAYVIVGDTVYWSDVISCAADLTTKELVIE